jgi:alkylated DNA repair protein alkB family protein 1
MPKDLCALSTRFARLCGYEVHPEASIVNFYLADSMMGGHVDNAELSPNPIVSVSLGCRCVFLIGKEDRGDVAPISLFLNSGDVVLQGGQSRFCVHGVPRVFEGTSPLRPSHGLAAGIPLEEAEHVCNYLSVSRINMNVRQVTDAQGQFPINAPRRQLYTSK